MVIKSRTTKRNKSSNRSSNVGHTGKTQSANKQKPQVSTAPRMTRGQRRDLKVKAKTSPEYMSTRAEQRGRTARTSAKAGAATAAVQQANDAYTEGEKHKAEIEKYKADRQVEIERARATQTRNINVTGLENAGMVRATKPTDPQSRPDSEYNDSYYSRLERM